MKNFETAITIILDGSEGTYVMNEKIANHSRETSS